MRLKISSEVENASLDSCAWLENFTRSIWIDYLSIFGPLGYLDKFKTEVLFAVSGHQVSQHASLYYVKISLLFPRILRVQLRERSLCFVGLPCLVQKGRRVRVLNDLLRHLLRRAYSSAEFAEVLFSG